MGPYLRLSGRGWGELIRGWAPINFFCLQDRRFFEVGANSRLGAYSNKYGMCKRPYSLLTERALENAVQGLRDSVNMNIRWLIVKKPLEEESKCLPVT